MPPTDQRPLSYEDMNRGPNQFRVSLGSRDEFDIAMHGWLPPGVVVVVRDYRLADDAEEGTTKLDDQGQPYFEFVFGSNSEDGDATCSQCDAECAGHA
jgi:hypothetical protein